MLKIRLTRMKQVFEQKNIEQLAKKVHKKCFDQTSSSLVKLKPYNHDKRKKKVKSLAKQGRFGKQINTEPSIDVGQYSIEGGPSNMMFPSSVAHEESFMVNSFEQYE